MKSFFEQFKTPIVTVIIIMIAFFVYTKLAGPIPFFINSVTTNQTNLFSASGEGKATAVPDQATVEAGVTGQGATVADAQNKINTQAQKIINSIKALGISEKDIKTTNYSVTPNYGTSEIMPMIYPPTRGGSNITDYTVTQNLEINVKDLTKVNKVIDSATANGANIVGGANFTFSDDLQKKLENQARTQAVGDAKQKAEALANTSGIHLGRVVNVVESGGFPRPLMMTAGEAKTDQSQPTNVTPGENSVTIDVTIYYETY
ncbi:MAG TPA: SIMPL domain-containing protein [Candidatus Sulfotelmatobacter sp.]|nr:SIMPL domain-containing protein [Candidatus Sulfotelmatobacter sp.]